MKQKIICFLLINILILTNISLISVNAITIENDVDDGSDINILDSGKNCALFVTGAGTIEWPNSAKIFERVGTNARNMFDSFNYNTWLEIQPDRKTLKDVIENQIPETLGNKKQIFIYIGAHGDIAGGLLIKRTLGLPSFVLAPSIFADWLKNMEINIASQGKSYSYCTIVIESCFSGNHISYLSKENRIIITSTDSSNSAYGSSAGEMYFSDVFFSSLSNGDSYGKAWELADYRIDTDKNIRSQDPRIEDTGNGRSVGTDEPDILPLYDGDTLRPFEKDGIHAKNLKAYRSSKSSVYRKPMILRYQIFRELFPDLFEPRPISHSYT